MARRNTLVRLTWLDASGEAYHTQDLRPTVAKELLRRSGVFRLDFPGKSYGHPLSAFSRAEVARSPRGVVGKKEAGGAPVVLITLPEDNEQAATAAGESDTGAK